MGEIKSTLDIVMEKTKHLSMTDEEKKANEKESVSLAVKGLVQKFQDHMFNIEAIQKELNMLHQQYDFEDNDVLADEIFNRLDLEKDNHLLLNLIQSVLQMDSKKIEDLLHRFHEEIDGLSEKRVEDMKQDLKENYSISGSAVVPNIKADSALQSEINNIKDQFRIELDEVKSEMVNQ